MKKSRLIFALAVLAVLAALLIWAQSRVHFNFALFRVEIADADWRKVGIAIACIYIGYLLRAARWGRLMRHNKKAPTLSLIGPQVIGFTGVALLGRFADLTRPYLTARKTGQPIASQIAVYVVERLFDAGSMAVLLAAAVQFIPAGALPHPEAVNQVKIWFLVGTLGGALFIVALRLAGGTVAAFFEAVFGLLSKKLGHSIGQKLRSFRTGLDTIRTFADFGAVTAYSLAMWLLILLAYLETANAFTANKQLASMSIADCAIILACSGGASFFQLPVLGWFTQIGIVGEAIHDFFGIAREAAWACAVMLLVDTFLSVLPVGLVWAQFEHVSLREVAEESGHVGEVLKNEEMENENKENQEENEEKDNQEKDNEAKKNEEKPGGEAAP